MSEKNIYFLRVWFIGSLVYWFIGLLVRGGEVGGMMERGLL